MRRCALWLLVMFVHVACAGNTPDPKSLKQVMIAEVDVLLFNGLADYYHIKVFQDGTLSYSYLADPLGAPTVRPPEAVYEREVSLSKRIVDVVPTNAEKLTIIDTKRIAHLLSAIGCENLLVPSAGYWIGVSHGSSSYRFIDEDGFFMQCLWKNPKMPEEVFSSTCPGWKHMLLLLTTVITENNAYCSGRYAKEKEGFMACLNSRTSGTEKGGNPSPIGECYGATITGVGVEEVQHLLSMREESVSQAKASISLEGANALESAFGSVKQWASKAKKTQR